MFNFCTLLLGCCALFASVKSLTDDEEPIGFPMMCDTDIGKQNYEINHEKIRRKICEPSSFRVCHPKYGCRNEPVERCVTLYDFIHKLVTEAALRQMRKDLAELKFMEMLNSKGRGGK